MSETPQPNKFPTSAKVALVLLAVVALVLSGGGGNVLTLLISAAMALLVATYIWPYILLVLAASALVGALFAQISQKSKKRVILQTVSWTLIIVVIALIVRSFMMIAGH